MFSPRNYFYSHNNPISSQTNNSYYENPFFPIPNDKPSNLSQNPQKYTLTLEECVKMNALNLQSYKNAIPKIVYSEENIELTRNSLSISFDELYNLINLKDPYPNYIHNTFVYKNYDYKNPILFNSKFESGNLRMAIKHSHNEYDLIIRPETNSIRTFQWFYFSIKLNKNSTSLNNIIKFNIINLLKKKIIFNDVVRVLCFYNNSWSRETNNIYLFPNEIVPLTEENQYYTLTFTFDINILPMYSNGYIYFAYCYPYTYTHLTRYIKSLCNYSKYLRFEVIGYSINNNAIYMLVITNFNDSFDTLAKKQAIVLTGRVHSGESNSSIVIEGVIEFLLSNDPIADKLRKLFIFKIIPMLNPDGVIRGNFRMNYDGKDLNRLWTEADLQSSPTIYYTKQMIQKTLNCRDIYLFCDFHGHSNKNNFFLYCCKSKNPSNPQSNSNVQINTTINSKQTSNFQELVFPYIFNKENLFFDRNACVNKINPGKLKTARAVLKMEYKVDFSYCLESSMGAIKLESGQYIPFTIELYKKIGRDFCKCLSKMMNSKIFHLALNYVKSERKERKKYNENKKVNSISAKHILPHVGEVGQSPRFSAVNLSPLGKKKNCIVKGRNPSLNSNYYNNNTNSNYNYNIRLVNYNSGIKCPPIDNLICNSFNK